jgi:hypothetical protein
MLRSPLASARLPPPMPSPNYGRPRSCTAPSTPLVEAPPPPLVELPGSTPERPRGSHHHSYDSKLRHSGRPRSHAVRPSHPWLHLPAERKSDGVTVKDADAVSSKSNISQSPREQQSKTLAANKCRFSEPVSHPRRIWSDPTPSYGALRPVSISPRCKGTGYRLTPQMSSTDRPTDEEAKLFYDKLSQSNREVSQTADVSSLQASHEAHIAALKEVHQREIASLHLYIGQLQPRHGFARSREHHANNIVRHYPETQSNGTDKHTEIWLERNHLRNTLDMTNTRLARSQEAMHRLQGVEKTLQAEIEGLRSRTLVANDQQPDAHEGLHDTRRRVGGRVEHEKTTSVHELEGLQIRSPDTATIGQQDEGHNRFDAHTTPRNSEQDPPNTSPGSQSSPPSFSPSRTLSPSSALGISMPQTPRTIASATVEALLVSTETPDAYTQPRTPPTGVHKELPLPPLDASPVPAHLRRGAKMRSVGESIIELYGAGWDCGWSAKGVDKVEGTGWVEWV